MEKFYKILLLDLEKKKYEIEYIDKKNKNFYMGGFALSLFFLNKNKDFKNPWMIFTSSIIEYKNPISKFIIMGKNNSGKIFYKNMGGNFSYFLKSNSYDGLVLLNKSDFPVEIYIDKDKILFNENSNKNHLNSSTFNYLRKKYGDNLSSIYITNSTIKKDNLARLVEDKYRGCSKNLSNLLYEKNVISISVKKNNLRKINIPSIFKNNPNRQCDGCILGCFDKKFHEKENLFSIKNSYNDYDLEKLNKIKTRLDEYGIDIYGLSKSIEFSYKYLNHIYKFENLNIDQLDNITKKIVSDKKDEIYSDLACGRKYLEKKYKIKSLSDKKRKNIPKDYLKIIDSAGMCLFATNPKDLSNIVNTINELSNLNYSIDDVKNLIKEIGKLESSLN